MSLHAHIIPAVVKSNKFATNKDENEATTTHKNNSNNNNINKLTQTIKKTVNFEDSQTAKGKQKEPEIETKQIDKGKGIKPTIQTKNMIPTGAWNFAFPLISTSSYPAYLFSPSCVHFFSCQILQI